MAKPDESAYTSGDGELLIEIVCESAPITPEARERARRRALWNAQHRRGCTVAAEPVRPADQPSDMPE